MATLVYVVLLLIENKTRVQLHFNRVKNKEQKFAEPVLADHFIVIYNAETGFIRGWLEKRIKGRQRKIPNSRVTKSRKGKGCGFF